MNTSRFETVVLSLLIALPLSFAAERPRVEATAQAILDAVGVQGGLAVVLGCGEPAAPEVAAGLGKNGNWLVHAVAGTHEEWKRFNEAIGKAQVKGLVSAEVVDISVLPYRDYLVDVLVIMDAAKARKAGFRREEARRCVVPRGTVVICRGGVPGGNRTRLRRCVYCPELVSLLAGADLGLAEYCPDRHDTYA